ncbi:Metallo-dependent phosphatase-like protein [Aspergillus avenaceus]|uniref:Metallo-dependent phosphatase-like protein n=1 Tax=Aspergillus avenaceus TaxID=36643 RepID=A0A5N6U2J4_ASPAV|nr:Metallo-dependent phosphatase-like protein [Aspergillus avenaceus]
MARWHSYFAAVLGITTAASGLVDDGVVITPNQQKEAYPATSKPSRGELPWGKMNFIHTTDTHGWLEGHMNERNSGGDWGDFVSFVKRMRAKADNLTVDLLLADTGDLHDGNGLSDISVPKGAVSDSIFANVEYDLLTIGNHGVQRLEEARNIQANISKIYGDRYLTSNVYIKEEGKEEEPIGVPYRYFTTKHNTRVMAFGVMYDDKKNDPNIKIENIREIMARSWFSEAMKKEVDLYVLLGHGSLRKNPRDPQHDGAFLDFQRQLRNRLNKEGKNIPIQLIGGHTHVRDFRCFDELTFGLQSGKYGDTVGWLALDNFGIKDWWGAKDLKTVATPKRKCTTEESSNVPLLDRRYLDWNVATFMYHTVGPNENDTAKFDTPLGRKVTRDIEFARHALNLTFHLGCAHETWCLWCDESEDKRNIMELAKPATLETVVNEKRRTNHRAVVVTGTTFRYDLFQGPFTVGDALTVVPYTDTYHFVELDYKTYSDLLKALHITVSPVEVGASEEPVLTPGYTTKDDFGEEGDDTKHSEFKAMGKNLPTVAVQSWDTLPVLDTEFKLDLVVTHHTEKKVRNYLKKKDPLPLYMEGFTTGDILPEYARRHWKANLQDGSCPIGP